MIVSRSDAEDRQTFVPGRDDLKCWRTVLTINPFRHVRMAALCLGFAEFDDTGTNASQVSVHGIAIQAGQGGDLLRVQFQVEIPNNLTEFGL
jgi:hypothetical protein